MKPIFLPDENKTDTLIWRSRNAEDGIDAWAEYGANENIIIFSFGNMFSISRDRGKIWEHKTVDIAKRRKELYSLDKWGSDRFFANISINKNEILLKGIILQCTAMIKVNHGAIIPGSLIRYLKTTGSLKIIYMKNIQPVHLP